MYKPSIRSRHPSHSPLKRNIERSTIRSIVRLGSTTTNEQYNRERANRGLRPVTNLIECNTVEAVKKSANKLLMKQCFDEYEVETAEWYTAGTGNVGRIPTNPPYPLVAKHIFGSRGTGNTLIETSEQLTAFLRNHENTLSSYIFEKFYNYSREYRLHVTKDGCFYTCRKMLKADTPEENRWFRNDSNCVWILEDNPTFDKPTNWANVVEESVKALDSVGLDIGAIDVRIQSARDSRGRIREYPEFIILETNSAPSFGEITLQKYLKQIPIILQNKRR